MSDEWLTVVRDCIVELSKLLCEQSTSYQRPAQVENAVKELAAALVAAGKKTPS